MKRIIIPIIAAAVAFMSCQKEETAVVVKNGVSKVTFNAVSVDTRTSFAPASNGSYPVLWNGTEEISVSYNLSGGKPGTISASSDGKTGTFEVAFEALDATSHNFYAVCPASALIGVSTNNRTLHLQIPSAQTPGEGTCDEAAQILYAKNSSSSFPSTLDLTFGHAVAYGNLSIVLPAGVSSITSVALTSEIDLAGRFYLDVDEGGITSSTATKSLTLNTSKTSGIYFACRPCDLSGTTLKVVINAGGRTYTKNLNLSGKTLKFEQGKVSKFTVDMSGISADAQVVYTLVTDPTTLKVGDKVIIAAADYDMAISTTQNTNNRSATAVTKTGNTIVNPGDAVQIFTLEKGSFANTCAFNTGGGYIYAASSSSNNMRTEETLSGNSSFAITVVDGKLVVVAKGSYSRNHLRYNNDSGVFSCYAENSSVQNAVAIYSDGKGSGAIFGNDTPTVPVYANLSDLVSAGEPTADGTNVTVTLTNEEIKSFYTSTSSSTGEVYKNGVYLEAGGRQVVIYCRDVPSDWVVGGKITATLVNCKWSIYKGLWELSPANWSVFTYTAPAGGGDTGGSVDESVTITWGDVADANGWENGVAYTSFTQDGITFTVTGGGNNGKYYTSDQTWRFYNGGKLTISAAGKTIKSISSNPSADFDVNGSVASIEFAETVRFKSITINY